MLRLQRLAAARGVSEIQEIVRAADSQDTVTYDSPTRMNDPTHRNDNRLELLLFNLGGRQRFGINVLKVKEVIPCPALTHVPHAHATVCGVATLRGVALSVIDLSRAIGRAAIETHGSSVLVTEFNRATQGFLVERVERIVVCDWNQVTPPPHGSGARSYISGVTRVDDALVQILDIERVLVEVVEPAAMALDEDISGLDDPALHRQPILVVDDSAMARAQTTRMLDEIGVSYILARDGREALEALRKRRDDEAPVAMVISDIEMPEIDGYGLTEALRADPRFSHMYVLLHTSLNGAINSERARQCGADDILTKFVPGELARCVVTGLRKTLATAK